MKDLFIAAMVLLASAQSFAQDRGLEVFSQNCMVCHQEKGEGMPGFAPKLAGTLVDRSKTEAGRRYFAQLVVSGMMGPIISGGEKFNAAMPSFSTLSNEDLVAVLGYVLGELNGASNEARVTAEDVSAARRQVMSPVMVHRLRDR